MKCPICNGKGTQFIADYDGMYDIVCEQCKGKGEVDENGKPIFTNEEYLRSCTTEQLAEFLADELNDVVERVLEGVWLNDGDTDRDEYYQRQTDVLEWLKQPHTTKE